MFDLRNLRKSVETSLRQLRTDYLDILLLHECTEAVLGIEGHSAHEIFGSPDDLKFHASMTLFARAALKGQDFQRALDRFFDGQRHAETIELLRSDRP